MTTAQTTRSRWIGGFGRHPMIEGMVIGALVAALAAAFLATRNPVENARSTPAIGDYTLTKVLQAEHIGEVPNSVATAPAEVATPQPSYSGLKVEQAKSIGGVAAAAEPSVYTLNKLEQVRDLGSQQGANRQDLDPRVRYKMEQIRELP
ncbi:MAG TPA: hypothetical protein VE569_08895 [Acidimicrobiia bacterium]|nr:hypothetical protein [Acidimicrobiia bacterium]